MSKSIQVSVHAQCQAAFPKSTLFFYFMLFVVAPDFSNCLDILIMWLVYSKETVKVAYINSIASCFYNASEFTTCVTALSAKLTHFFSSVSQHKYEQVQLYQSVTINGAAMFLAKLRK